MSDPGLTTSIGGSGLTRIVGEKLFQGVGDGPGKEGGVSELNKLKLLVARGGGIQPQYLVGRGGGWGVGGTGSPSGPGGIEQPIAVVRPGSDTHGMPKWP